MEMRNRQVNHARNVWDRAVTILPRANQFWYKYTYMEEMLGNIAGEHSVLYLKILIIQDNYLLFVFKGARQVFERWMEWQPEEQAWFTYINFELRYKEVQRAREIYNQFVMVHPQVKNWIKFARYKLFISVD